MEFGCHLAPALEWALDRKFKPQESYNPAIGEETLSDGCWTYLACGYPCRYYGRLAAHVDCIVIAIDDACRNIGYPNARAAAAVFFGMRSEFNTSFVMNTTQPTNQKAELTTGIHALRQALVIKTRVGHSYGVDGGRLRKVVIRSDSQYLVRAMTEWIFHWETNGYWSSNGRPVVNASLFRQLDRQIMDLNQLDVEVNFWHVPRARNEQADRLANDALHHNWSEADEEERIRCELLPSL
ncbi:MAG: hypothetical protein M1819_006536 [Sarea resinae]|nr:MAG: hypothetical protein M1819_006536 [Sarea resinae]